jgi:hypothetical protein
MEVLMSDTQEKRTGGDILHDIERHLSALDSIDPEDADGLSAWKEELRRLTDEAPDKMLAYRTVIELAKGRQDFFRKQRERYAVRFRAQGRVVSDVKELSHLFLKKHHELTGDKRLVLKDGTWATLSKSAADWLFYDQDTGDTNLSPDDLPPEYVKQEISRSALKQAAKSGRQIPGVEYVKVYKTHVRWS